MICCVGCISEKGKLVGLFFLFYWLFGMIC